MKVPKTPQEALANAIEYIDMLGWHQRSFQDWRVGGGGAVCAMGALTLGVVDKGVKVYETADSIISESPTKRSLFDRAEEALMRALSKRNAKDSRGHRVRGIPSYNDFIAKKPEQIKSLMNSAIKILDQETTK